MKSVTIDFEINPEEKLFEENVMKDECAYTNLSSKFTFRTRDFSRQYAHIYSKRLLQMKDILTKRAIQKWGKNWSMTLKLNNVLQYTVKLYCLK